MPCARFGNNELAAFNQRDITFDSLIEQCTCDYRRINNISVANTVLRQLIDRMTISYFHVNLPSSPNREYVDPLFAYFGPYVTVCAPFWRQLIFLYLLSRSVTNLLRNLFGEAFRSHLCRVVSKNATAIPMRQIDLQV